MKASQVGIATENSCIILNRSNEDGKQNLRSSALCEHNKKECIIRQNWDFITICPQ